MDDQDDQSGYSKREVHLKEEDVDPPDSFLQTVKDKNDKEQIAGKKYTISESREDL